MDKETIETFDSENETEDITVNDEVVEETIDESDSNDDDPEALKELNKRLFLRAKKAEEKAKTLAQQVEANVGKSQSTNTVEADELRLIAKGLTDDEIEEAKSIAKGKGLSLSEAVKTPIFELYQKDLQAKEKAQKAKLGASKGSTQVNDNSFKPGMTAEEHKKLWEETK